MVSSSRTAVSSALPYQRTPTVSVAAPSLQLPFTSVRDGPQTMSIRGNRRRRRPPPWLAGRCPRIRHDDENTSDPSGAGDGLKRKALLPKAVAVPLECLESG